MTLNERLRFLRRKKDYTQEQLAEYLGISSQAVSRWETGATSPDISLLPMLGECFGVTMDELLGVNEGEKQREIDRIVRECELEINRNRWQEPIPVLREALNRYPGNDRLLVTLMYALYAGCEDEDFCREHDGEIIAIAARIAEFSRDEYCRNESKRLLFRHYCDTGRKTDALRIAEGFPDAEHCYQSNIYWALDGKERLEHLRERISDGLRELDWAIWAYSVHGDLSDEKRDELNAVRENVKALVGEHFPE